MQTQTTTTNRLTALTDARTNVPKPILAICILGFIGLGLSIIGLLSSWSLIASIGTFFLLYYIVSLAVSVLALVWLFKMKKKGAYLNAGLFVATQIVIAAYGVFAINLTFLISVAIVAIALYYSKDMN